ncbi:MAG: helix-turn-helix domain-containing protein [Acidimicrobiia bacterium]|nr:helix-turn-helix domain-containing protein [Acidimicrobiia bacterium]
MAEHTTAHPPLTLDAVADRVTLTVEEAAALLGLGRSAAYEAARRGQIPTRRLGRRVVVPVPALLAWLGAEDDRTSTAA